MKSWDAALIKIFTVMLDVHFCERKPCIEYRSVAYAGSRKGGGGVGDKPSHPATV